MRNARKILPTIAILLLLSTGIFATVNNQPNADFYKSSFDISLRAPAFPLVLSDPYLSIWSPYNKLTEGNSQHWTGEEHPLIGAIRVDGKTYRFMGKDVLCLASVISADESAKYWKAAYTFTEPSGAWMNTNYDDKAWKTGEAAFGTTDMPRVGTPWTTKDIWVRRTFDIEDDLSKETIILQYSHDDTFELYLNGEKLVDTGYSWNSDVQLVLTESQKKKLKKGKNVIAAHCHNVTGGAYVDFNLYKKIKRFGFETEAIQKSVDVLPTQTYYTFTCGKVELDLIFTASMLPNDMNLISTPINYISYRVRALDKKKHDVQIYMETTPQLAVNDLSQTVSTERIEKNGLIYLKTGTVEQAILKRKGDGVRIDWGYAYLVSDKANNKDLNIGNYFDMKEAFAINGTLTPKKHEGKQISDMTEAIPVLAYTENLGEVDKEGKTGYVMLGYDDIYSIEYFYKQKMAYWKQDGKVDIYQAFEKAKKNHSDLLKKCRDFDIDLITKARKAGGAEYAELCALVYRHVIAAHKLIKDDEGNLLFLSKENHSNGCINTVDLTYPSAPIFLYYNTDLVKAMMTSIFHYSESGRWTKPYPAHDLGTYPVANGQLYGEDMPVEEGGNMLLLATAVSKMDGNADYALKHWTTLKTWADYLVQKGLDPDNQLCTDDFAGHLAHNANLSIKAILGIAGFGHIAQMLGKQAEGDYYINQAKQMAVTWKQLADAGDHYKLAFDRSGTWSQKYNMIWDVIFEMGIFDSQIMKTEIPYYLTKQNIYGLPLDSRATYTKSDWVMWTACMAPDMETFQQFISPIYRYANETSSRVPLSDWHDTFTAKEMNFKARSVVGAYYMKMLFEKVNKNK